MKNKNTIIKILYILLIILFIAFIFSNSIETKDESASKSGRLLGIINIILEKINIPILATDTLIRKAAHFAEFFILGTLLFGYTLIDRKIELKNEIYASFIACLVAMSDETIQYFSNRGSMLLDVWLDFLSATLAISFFYLVTIIIKHKKAR